MQKGFTLIELMVTLAVLAITLSIAVPNFSNWIKDNRLDTSTRTVTGVFQLARSEAVTRQSIISVRPGTTVNPGNWADGVHIYTDTGVNGNAYNAVNDTLIRDIDADMSTINIADNDPNNIISFSSSGALNEGVGAQRTLTLCQSTGEPEGAAVTINFVGRASINTLDCP